MRDWFRRQPIPWTAPGAASRTYQSQTLHAPRDDGPESDWMHWQPEDCCRITHAGGSRLRYLDIKHADHLLQKRCGPGYRASADSDKIRYRTYIERKTQLCHDAVRRCVPWSRCLTVPHLHGSKFFDLRGLAVGQSPGNPPIIAMAICAGGVSSVSQTCHHEIWHVAERLMNPRIVRDIDAALRQGVAIGDEDYYDTDIERRARAYAAYAVTRDMGMYYEKPLREHTPQGAFEMVYTGNFGNMIVGSGDEVVAHWMSVGREEDEDDLWSVGY